MPLLPVRDRRTHENGTKGLMTTNIRINYIMYENAFYELGVC